jgi:hypothetical protein
MGFIVSHITDYIYRLADFLQAWNLQHVSRQQQRLKPDAFIEWIDSHDWQWYSHMDQMIVERFKRQAQTQSAQLNKTGSSLNG